MKFEVCVHMQGLGTIVAEVALKALLKLFQPAALLDMRLNNELFRILLLVKLIRRARMLVIRMKASA